MIINIYYCYKQEGKGEGKPSWRGDVSNSYSQHIDIRSRAFRLFTTTSVVLLCMREETNQLSVAAAVERCGWSKATRLHVLPTYISHRCNEYRLCGRKSRSSLCLTENLESKECCLFTHN